MKNRLLNVLFATLAALFWLVPAQAQDEESDGAADLVLITPKAGQGQALEDAIREYHLWVADKEGHFRYDWYAIDTGPDTGKYIARSGNHNWADFDAEYDWQDEAGEKFAELVAPHVESIHRKITEDMEEFSHWPESFEGYDHFQVETWYIKTGQYGKWRQGVETIHNALIEGGYPDYYGFQAVVSGGKGGEIHLVQPMKGYSGFAENNPSFFSIVSEALGGPEAFGEFMADFGSTYYDGHSMLVRYLPDASDYGDDE
ncbi:MAG: hypothetical protein R3212_03855 [Xanthomonadales bacterium]|nr:hypothetical protein [Xanthomonadales bacterium]